MIEPTETGLAVTGARAIAAAALELIGEGAIEIAFAGSAEDASPHASAFSAGGSAWLP